MGKVQLYFRYASYLYNTFTCNVFTSPVRRLEEFLQILVTSDGKKRKSL